MKMRPPAGALPTLTSLFLSDKIRKIRLSPSQFSTIYIVLLCQKIRGGGNFLLPWEGAAAALSCTILTITNQKGGVGKTTTAAAMLACLHRRGARVLGVDMDPQGSLGFSLGLDIDRCATLYDVFRGSAEPAEILIPTETCDMLPSNILLASAELEFNRPGREYLLKTALSKVADNYDVIVIDTPPALGLLTVNAYVATDQLLIPMAPEVLSLLGVSQIKETIESVRSYYNSHLEVAGILLNRFNPRLNLNREMLELAQAIAEQLDTKVFQSKIRSSVSVAASPAHGLSVVDFAPTAKPALDFEDLCEELFGRRFPRREEEEEA